jgi:GxxExxY protein
VRKLRTAGDWLQFPTISDGNPVASIASMTNIVVLDAITDDIIGSAIKVHKRFGPGLLESVYHLCLAQELVASGHQIDVGKPIEIEWKEFRTECAYRMDLVVDDQVIVEVKSVDRIADIHRAQMLTYMKLTGLSLGLILNFNVEVLKDGIRRVANNLRDDRGKMV